MRPLDAPFLTGAGMLAIIFVVPFFRMSKAKGRTTMADERKDQDENPLENLAEEISQAMQGTTVEVAQTFKDSVEGGQVHMADSAARSVSASALRMEGTGRRDRAFRLRRCDRKPDLRGDGGGDEPARHQRHPDGSGPRGGKGWCASFCPLCAARRGPCERCVDAAGGSGCRRRPCPRRCRLPSLFFLGISPSASARACVDPAQFAPWRLT